MSPSITDMSKKKDRVVRTTITLPLSLKQKMAETKNTNWSEVIRDYVSQRLAEEGER